MQPANAPRDLVILTGQPIVGKGSVRDVYVHPTRPDYLIKVFNDRKRADARQGVRGAARFVRPHYPYGDFIREQAEYMRCVILAGKLGCAVPIAEIASLTPTDLGTGQIVRRIGDGHGGVAKTVLALLSEGRFDADHLALLNSFMAEIWTLEVNAPDLSCTNVAFDGDAHRFVLVDGIGEKTIIPVRAWVGALNRRKLHKMAHGMAYKMQCSWDEAARRFH